MQTVLLMGAIGAGKSTLLRALSGGNFRSRRAMAVERHGRFLLTPGEFLENRRFYHALISTAADCDIVLLLQSAAQRISLYPPQFAAVFHCTVLGVVTQLDAPGANVSRAELFLCSAGVSRLFPVSATTGEGLEALRAQWQPPGKTAGTV